MRIVVVIPTFGRKAVLGDLVAELERQDRLPDEVVISAPDVDHAEPLTARGFTLTYLFGRVGLCAQRNRALDDVLGRADIVTFFDDDFIPAPDYLARLEQAFAERAEWAVITGNVVLDGARNAGISLDDARRAARGARERTQPRTWRAREGAYGCNMSFRASIIGDQRFDERLPLYGWLEDIDFSSRMRAAGQVVWVSDIVGAHMGVKGGRSSGVRLGYSQVVNPVYLIRKGSLSRRLGLRLVLRNVASNIARSVRPEAYTDRRGRLWGNLLAIAHLVRGRVDPMAVTTL